ncbi:hypothetical protein HAZT_HAZT005747 [Hyalella azteca]|uniref:Nuclear cap-binding protein subunit 1 n=1 Tax=Hyalella azteca TaxID=294128 RepID=A0A6A0H858_HYAAZ|nr:hypothetical protein HAZT_HAZT005747 [Hyalella azteca]
MESNLEGLASVLEADINNYRNKILKILSECAVKMPEKTTIYTTLVGLLNAKNYIFGGEFVDLMARKLKDALKSCMWKTALRSDTYIYAVLSSLPWVGRELYEKKEQDLEKLLKHIEIYVNKRSCKHVAGLRVWRSDSPHPQEEYLDCLWAQICKLRSDNWQEKHIARPYVAFDQVLCEALQHNIPVITPPPHSPDNTYPFPWVVFRLFAYTDCPEGPILPGAHSIERYLIEEHLHNIIKQFHLERKQCASFLLDFPLKQKIPLEYVIVEVVLAEMFHLPASRYLQICYGSLLIELCKLQPATMPQVLAQAVELLFERIDTMNTCCHDRFVSWFAYHLSNFQFKWSWDDWLHAAKLPVDHPRAKFVVEVLQRCMRLSYHDRIAEVVPEQFDCFVPAKPKVIFRYDPDLGGESYVWEILHATIRKMSKHVARLQKDMLDSRDSHRRRRSGAETRRASDESESNSDNSSDEDTARPRPTEEEIERMEEKLETAHTDQKNLFLIIFQRFIMLLSEHLSKCDTERRDYDTHWYRWTVGRLQQIFMQHNNQVERYGKTLNELLFTPDLDSHILDIFNQFMSLRA